MKQLIVTADDYGVFPSINEGVKLAIRRGNLNSAACFSNHSHSVKHIRELTDEFGNTVDIGCHLTISSGRPLHVAGNPAFTRGDYFRDFSELDIDAILKQPEELKKELVAQIQVLLDNGIAVNHLSCHHNTLTTVRGLMQVYLEVAAQFNLPMRSVNIQPEKKDSNYRLVLDLLLADNVPVKTLKEINRFKKEIAQMVRDFGTVKTPDWLESSHYGPLPLIDVWENGVERRKREKHADLDKFIKGFLNSTSNCAELMLHLIQYQDHLSGLDDAVDYPGVNTKYFDSRQIELRSILDFNFGAYQGLTMGSWKHL